MISVDPPRVQAAFKAGLDARFPFLSDEGLALTDAQDMFVEDISGGGTLMVSGSPVFVDKQDFLTPPLWGVGNSGPWLHDGRAGSLDEAIRLHGVNSPPMVGDSDRSEAGVTRGGVGSTMIHCS